MKIAKWNSRLIRIISLTEGAAAASSGAPLSLTRAGTSEWENGGKAEQHPGLEQAAHQVDLLHLGRIEADHKVALVQRVTYESRRLQALLSLTDRVSADAESDSELLLAELLTWR